MRFAHAVSVLASCTLAPALSFSSSPLLHSRIQSATKATTVLFSTTAPTMTAVTTEPASSSTNSTVIGAVGSKLTDMELAREALSKFFDDDQYIAEIKLTPTTGGVNNIVQYVTLPNGDKELLRIYNNGCDAKRVNFEHEILKRLNLVQGLSFQVPCFLTSADGSNQTMVRLSNGADACMCKIIPGHLPKLTCAQDLGRAAGELNTALAALGQDLDRSLCSTAPYWKMWKVHHAVTREKFVLVMQGPYFDATRAVADRMLAETLAITDRCETAYQSSLPVQLIHGDLHYDNVLVQDGRVTALLDFEFASFDWRAMELAIGLSKYAGEEPESMPYFDDYIDGYAMTGKLTKEEAQAIPDLINLRILSNIVYFVGRHLAGEDDISTITTRIENYARRVEWIKSNSDIIVNRIVEKMNL